MGHLSTWRTLVGTLGLISWVTPNDLGVGQFSENFPPWPRVFFWPPEVAQWMDFQSDCRFQKTNTKAPKYQKFGSLAQKLSVWEPFEKTPWKPPDLLWRKGGCYLLSGADASTAGWTWKTSPKSIFFASRALLGQSARWLWNFPGVLRHRPYWSRRPNRHSFAIG